MGYNRVMKYLIILSFLFLVSCADLKTQAYWNNQAQDGETKVTVRKTVRSPTGDQWDESQGEVVINKKNRIKSYGFSIGNK